MTEDQIAYLADKLGDWAGYSPDAMKSMLEAANPGMPKHTPERPTLRDQFAMAALTGYIAHRGFQEDAGRAAYAIADAMMKEMGG